MPHICFDNLILAHHYLNQTPAVGCAHTIHRIVGSGIFDKFQTYYLSAVQQFYT